jgi:hypothetical protein
MDWLQFIASIVGSVAWPLAAIACVLFLRKEVVQLLRRLRRLKYGDAEAEFGEKLEELESEVSDIPEPASLPETVKRVQSHLSDAGQFSNNSAVFIAWLEVESAILNLARDADVLRTNMSASIAAQRLLDREIIGDSVYRAVRELQQLRNIAVHPTSMRLISNDEVDRFKKLAEKIAAWLEDRRRTLKRP